MFKIKIQSMQNRVHRGKTKTKTEAKSKTG